MDLTVTRHARLRAATLGRACRWCPATDATAYWSPRNDECARCWRQRRRRKCGTCGGPFYVLRVGGRPAGCPWCAEATAYERMVRRGQR